MKHIIFWLAQVKFMSNTTEWMALGLYGVNTQVTNGGVLL
jgi:hypothetical protein